MKKIILLCGLVFLQAMALPQERFRKSPPVPDPLQPLRLPVIESARLNNGLTLAVAYQKDLPFISLELIVLAGESSSPRSLPGLATLTAGMLSRGTPLSPASEIEEKIESIGGSFSAAASLDYSRFSFMVLDENLDQALEVLGQMVLQPGFADREILNLRRIEYYGLLQKQRDPEFVGRRQLLRILFKDHPYERSLYNEDVLKNITRKDILAFYQQYYRPNNSVLVMTGNLNLRIATRKVSHYLSTWQEKEVERVYLPPPAPNNEEMVCFIELPQAKDPAVLLGNVIFPYGDPDFFPFSVLNQVLGGTPNSRLFMNLRESKEYAYYAFSEMELFRSCGVYFVRAKVTPPSCFASVQDILGEIDRMIKERTPTFEIEQAKSYLIGNFPLQLDRLDNFARKLSEKVAMSLGEGHWNEFYENIMLVDSNRVFQVAEKCLLPKPVVVLVGDRSVLSNHLGEFKKIEIYDVKGVHQYTITKGAEE